MSRLIPVELPSSDYPASQHFHETVFGGKFTKSHFWPATCNPARDGTNRAAQTSVG